MPNTGRYTLCPFYLHDNKRSITCEDLYRTFHVAAEKEHWMDVYCDQEWERCPYAIDLWNMYERLAKGEIMAQKEHNEEALRKELHKLSTMLGSAEKRASVAEERYFAAEKRYREVKEEFERLQATLLETAHTYEARFCYLIEEFGGGVFSEKDFWDWVEGKEYRLVAYKRDENGKPVMWEAEVREVEEDGMAEGKTENE